MTIRPAKLSDKAAILNILDEFRSDCIEQITGKPGESNSARTDGVKVFEKLLTNPDYCIRLLVSGSSEIVGIITGYLCPLLRSGQVRAEVEEFYVKKEYRGQDNAEKLMDAFFAWCQSKNVIKVNLESENQLHRAHGFYKKYGFESKAVRFVKKIDIPQLS
jgi:ribosomal protein S18 acetylase RimI-like enzyme